MAKDAIRVITRSAQVRGCSLSEWLPIGGADAGDIPPAVASGLRAVAGGTEDFGGIGRALELLTP